MYSNEDVVSVLGFIKSTPEGSLRKMLVGGDLSDVHFRLLLKLAKNSPEADFITAFQADNFPAMRLSPAESKVKEDFWKVCKGKLSSMGLLNLGSKAA